MAVDIKTLLSGNVPTGAQGQSGVSGFSGISGFSGFSGNSGYSGFSGISGYSGSMQYPTAGIAVSTGSGWGDSKTTSGSGDIVLTNNPSINSPIISAPTIGSPIISNLKEVRVSLSANDIDLSSGNYFTKTITTATTFTVSNIPIENNAVSFILDLTNGGVAAITWWSGVKWVGGTAPTLTASGKDSLAFYTYDGGTTWTGLVLGKDIK